MAGNIVKWWKHKILGGYKQFSVQECTTDSEELMFHQVRASSSCSAPPDLLLVNDRENNIPLRSEVADVFGAATTPPSIGVNACPDLASSNNNQKLQHQQQQHHHPQQQQQQLQHKQHHQQPQHTHVTSYNNSSKDVNGRHQKVVGIKQVQHCLQQPLLENEGHVETQQNYSSTRHAQQHHQQRPEEHIRLEEFTCDVSVEGGKSSQPLQFSFTFYDLDGHHGKITKDDIVGIVYTIYESIGKSVVVPHSGSKTINVRLTVSPEGKSKASKVKKQQNVTSQKDAVLTSGRRLHRYRPRKLIKSDDEDDDSNSEKEREGAEAATNINNHNQNKGSKTIRTTTKTKVDQQCCQQPQIQQFVGINNHDSIFEHLKKGPTAESCQECLSAVEETRNATIPPTHNNLAGHPHLPTKSPSSEAYMKHIASTRIKMLRKSRKQKYQDCMETRQRSLSVGSEACWNNRHLQKTTQQQTHWNADQYLNSSDMLDGVQLRNPLSSEKLPMAQKRNTADCWKSALNRNDLISIIRESMEKNRLCFQLNGKPQANVSPIRQSSDHQHLLQHKHAQREVTQQQRQRSNTVSKIPMLIANHSYRSSSFPNNNDLSPNEHHNNSSNSNNIYQIQPHIPIYDPHVAMNPLILTHPNGVQSTSSGNRPTAVHHSKMNLCGYDSFLHATICGGGLSHSPPPQTPMHSQPGAAANSHHSLHQQIATVQPIMSSLNTSSQRAPKNMGLSMTPNQIRTSKILRSGSYSQSHQTAFTSTQNSPHHHGYQRLCTNRQNLSALNIEKTEFEMLENGRKEQIKNYDQLLYAKLTEKLQQTNLATTNKENVQRRRHRVVRHRRSSATVAEANKVRVPTVSFSKTNDYSSLIPIGADPVECENLIVPTSDDESHSHYDMGTKSGIDVQLESAISRHVAEGTLVDLDDGNRDEKSNAIDNSISNKILGLGSDNINDIHLVDELGVDEELDEELAEREEIGLNKSGRSSAASKEANEDTVANACGTNTSATSSLIHRYVHEHIHHHYHHFEDKDE